MEENQKEATDRWDEAKREGEKDATGCCTQKYIVAEKEDVVGVAMSGDGAC